MEVDITNKPFFFQTVIFEGYITQTVFPNRLMQRKFTCKDKPY